MNHALVNPPVDRNLPPDETSDVYVHVEEENDNGIVVSGAKVVATASVFNHHTFVAHVGAPLTQPEYALIFICPMGRPRCEAVRAPLGERAAVSRRRGRQRLPSAVGIHTAVHLPQHDPPGGEARLHLRPGAARRRYHGHRQLPRRAGGGG